jgi:hypothetical protein
MKIMKWISVGALATIFLTGAAFADASQDTWAVLIGGGFTFNSTYAPDYRGIKDLKGILLTKSVPEKHILTYFAEGCKNGSVRIAAILKKPCAFVPGQPNDIELSNAKSNVLAGFSEVAKNIADGGTLVVGIATHGEKNGDIDLQNHTLLTIADFHAIFAPLEARGIHIILISSACYSGNLHRLAGGNTCAFAESDSTHLTAETLWSESILTKMATAIGAGAPDFLAAFTAAKQVSEAKKLQVNHHYTDSVDSLVNSSAAERANVLACSKTVI